MKKINIIEKINGIKRDIKLDEFVKIEPPSNDDPENTVKIFTENVYLPEIGSYIVIVWDFKRKGPAILVLSHTLFAALKRWRSEAMQDIIGKTFTIVSKTTRGVVYHDLYCRGLLPLMNDSHIEIMNDYIDNLFDIRQIEGEDLINE